jgi:site-specific recombinase XerD
MKEFAQLLGDFLLDYIPRRRNLSPNTAMSYRDSFVLLLGWFFDETGIAPDDIQILDLSRERIESFCMWLSEDRGVSAATVNVRLCALRSFAGYVSFTEPAHLKWASDLRSIKSPRSPSKEIEYLSPEAIGLIIDSARCNIRDLALLALLYDSGSRVSEISGAVCSDLHLDKPATVRLKGKGSKTRVVPICNQVATIAAEYLSTHSCSCAPGSPLFCNRSGKPIGRAGIAWVLSKYASAARTINPELVPLGVHPHTLRHSKAVHLLESGVNLVYIRDFLGHSSVSTTEIYARSSTKAKREAIEKAAANVITDSAYSEEAKSDLIEWLKTIM